MDFLDQDGVVEIPVTSFELVSAAVSSPTHRRAAQQQQQAAAPAADGAEAAGAPGAGAAPRGSLRRLGARIDSWGSSSRLLSSLLRHSSIGGSYIPTGRSQPGPLHRRGRPS